MVLSYIARTLSQIPNCFNNDVSFGGRIRKRYLTTFIPPSTKTPIFRYGGNDDQRSFLSLVSNDHYEDDPEDPNAGAGADDVNSFQSLPADMDDIESDPELQTLLNRERSSHTGSLVTKHDDDEDGEEDDDDDGVDRTSENLNPKSYFRAYEDSENHKKTPYNNDTNNNNLGTSTDKILRLNRQNSKASVKSRKSVSSATSRRVSYGAIPFGPLDGLIGINNRYNDDDEEEDFEHETVTLKSEIKIFVKNTIPLIIAFCLGQSYTIICTVTASKVFGKNELAAVSLGSMTATITFSIFEGISTALDVLCSQAYGSGNIKKVGLYTQRSIVLSLVIFLPFAILWWNAHYFFRLVLETEELVRLTSSFIRTLILAAPAFIIFENSKRFLQCQGIFNASSLVLFVSTPFSIACIKVLSSAIGFEGIAITCVLNFWIMCTLMLCYIIFIDGRDCWNGFTKDAFNGWGELARFSFAGVVCTFLESSSWEILSLFSSFFGTSALAAQSAISTVAALTFFIPFAVGIACSTRVANFIGAKRIDGPAQIATHIGLVAAVASGFFNCLILYFGKSFIAHVYSNDDEVIALIIKVLPLVAVIQIFDALNTVSGSLLRGQGSPYIGGIINFVGYDFFAIPLALVLGYHLKLELIGLWIGIGLGLLIIGVSETYWVLKVDWEVAVQKCMERNKLKV